MPNVLPKRFPITPVVSVTVPLALLNALPNAEVCFVVSFKFLLLVLSDLLYKSCILLDP